MIGVDTNVLVRYFVDDDPAQANQVEKFISDCRARGERIFVSSIVLCELAWTLRSGFHVDRARILLCLSELLDSELFVVDRDDEARTAVHLAQTSKGDFSDYLIGAIAVSQGSRYTVTFDRALDGHAEFHL